MSLWNRMTLIFKSKAHRALDRAENPAETLDYSYQRQVELLAKMKRGVVDVSTARKRIEMQAADLEKKATTLSQQAEKAIAVGREDLAREALTRKAALVIQVTDLKTQYDQLVEEEEKLTRAVAALGAKVEAFRTKKETIKAQYTAAKAQTEIAESFSGISGEMADVGHAIQRAEDKTLQLRARASAVDELIASGALDDITGTGKDSLTRELDALASNAAVEAELAAMRGAIASPNAPRELQ